MTNQEKLAGLIKEKAQEATSEAVARFEERQVKNDEERVKLLEAIDGLKAQVDSMKDKKFKDASTGANYVYKGFNPETHRGQFSACIPQDAAEKIAKTVLDAASGKAMDFASEMPTEFGQAIMGLGELNSAALSTMRTLVVDSPVLKLPAKATRETSDAQASATANTSTSITAATITWTIDKRIGSYAEVRIDQLEDSKFDIVNGYLLPLMAEGIGQYVDAEVFNGTNSEFTSSIVDAGAGVTVSGAVNMAAAITFANLNTLYHDIAWERGIQDGKWYGSRAALAAIRGLVDSNGQPLLQSVPVNGRPFTTVMGSEYVITPVVANVPANGAIRLAFGDPNQYVIALRGGIQHLVNPYILMKEDVVQFIAKLRGDGNIADNATASSSDAWTNLKRTDS